jgi:predicted Zn-dependent protease
VAAANPAAAALLGQANEQTRAGELDQASSSLERALRIEPNNPWIWHQLAQVRLSQRQDEQAVQMAGRSNTLTSDRGLQARNWRVIAQARARLGQEEAARSAAAKARDLGGP